LGLGTGIEEVADYGAAYHASVAGDVDFCNIVIREHVNGKDVIKEDVIRE